MGSERENRGASRPHSRLLRLLSTDDFTALQANLEEIEGRSGQVLYHPGDHVENVYFPCGQALVSFAVAVEEDRDVQAIMVGNEGAMGGIVSRGFLPAYSRVTVRLGGPLVRLSVRKLAEAQHQSPSLRQLFARYADCFVAQIFQSTACNAAHSVEQRAAKWIISAVEHSGGSEVRVTHEQLADFLGIGRTYTSRIIQQFRTSGLIETGRGTLIVRQIAALHQRSCKCNFWVKKHFEEVFTATDE
ncbi:hypothetical protein ABIA99_007124 [Bradyrhizobium sp. LB12.1]